MNVLIEARSLSAQGGGVKNYTYQLIKNLIKLGGEIEYSVIYDSQLRRGTFKGAGEVVVPKIHQALLPLWLNWQMPRAIKRLKPDVVHFTKADIPKRKVFPTVVTIYDIIPLLFPESQEPKRRWYWPRALKRAATLSDKVITISEASKLDIVNFFNVDEGKITVAPPAVDFHYFKAVSERPYEFPYILFVGTRDKRKNVGALLRSFAAIMKDIPHKLVIAGQSAFRPDEAEAEAKRLKLGDRVVFEQFISREKLPALYSGADIFVWPSVYEGWGLPPQEAMASGTPVITSNGGAIPEVVGTAGEVVEFTKDNLAERTRDAEFESRLADKIQEVLGNSEQRATMKRKGLERVHLFSWGHTAYDTKRVYIELADE